MILTCHLLVGAAIASQIQFVPLALILAFLSHYFLDLLPQIDYSITNIKAGRWHKSSADFLKVFLDISFGLLLILLFSERTPLIFAGALLAIVPDGITLLAVFFNKNILIKIHQKFHKMLNSIGETKKIPLLGKILSQVLVILIAISYLLQ
jgi:hypothetical protein